MGRGQATGQATGHVRQQLLFGPRPQGTRPSRPTIKPGRIGQLDDYVKCLWAIPIDIERIGLTFGSLPILTVRCILPIPTVNTDSGLQWVAIGETATSLQPLQRRWGFFTINQLDRDGQLFWRAFSDDDYSLKHAIEVANGTTAVAPDQTDKDHNPFPRLAPERRITVSDFHVAFCQRLSHAQSVLPSEGILAAPLAVSQDQ